MAVVNKSSIMPFTSKQMYDLVNDVAQYPSFLPWCKNVVIHKQDLEQLQATLYIGKGLIVQSISTHNTMIQDKQIKMNYKDGPFKSCFGSWDFTQLPDAKCNVQFNMQYEFKNPLQAFTLEPLFAPLTTNLIDAFYKRAQLLYGG